MYFAGIDPGLTGALAIINEKGKIIKLVDYPRDNPKELYKLFYALEDQDITLAIEKIFFSPKQSFDRQFKYLATFFEQIFLCNLFGVKYKIIDSRAWKKEFKLNKEKDKSIDMVLTLFDDASKYIKLKKHHNRAEALLIAEYLRRSC